MKTLKQSLAESPVGVAIITGWQGFYPEMIRMNPDGSARVMRTKADGEIYGADWSAEQLEKHHKWCIAYSAHGVNICPLSDEEAILQ
jgi:hypothetical protein